VGDPLVCAERDEDVFEKEILDAVFDCNGRDYESCLKRQAQRQVNVIRPANRGCSCLNRS
jgi:hypothetical protein